MLYAQHINSIRHLTVDHIQRDGDKPKSVVDTSHVSVLKRRSRTGPSLVDPGRLEKPSDHRQARRAVLLTWQEPQRRHPVLPLLDAIPPIRGVPRSNPDSLFADRGYDHDVYRDHANERGMTILVKF
ncbi:hypothetical protein ACWD4N_21835 [Streptomyces sp. NPDC002586]